jgi:RimJ/RimL family protein N-acetyltransferase
MRAEGAEFDAGELTNPANHYYSITDKDGELVAYCCFGPEGRVPGGTYDSTALDVGMGLRPDLTGQGRGSQFLHAIAEFAHQRYAPTAFRVTVAAFNSRALRLCRRAGFREVQRFNRERDGLRFVILVLDA